MAGRANLIKMVWLPQLLYLLHNSPVWIGEKWFQRIQSLFRELIWKKGQARIGLQKLQCPATEGGLGVPHPFTSWQPSYSNLGDAPSTEGEVRAPRLSYREAHIVH